MKQIIFIILFITNIFANGWQDIHRAVYQENYSEINRMLSEDFRTVHILTNNELTPLHLAVKMRNFKLIQLFLKNGADIDAQDKQGRTPLLYAISQNKFKLAKFFILNGADFNLENSQGITPLHQASFSGNIEIVKFLLNIGAETGVKSKTGSTPFQIAVTKGHFHIADYLMFYKPKSDR